MELFFKKPTNKTRDSMCQAALELGVLKKTSNKYKSRAEDLIKDAVNHEHVWTVNSGNSAILAVMSTFKGPLMLPDQGGWGGIIKIAETLGLEILYLPTQKGLVSPELLESYMDKKSRPEAFFITSFAGYTAEQPLKDIYEVCEEKKVILVEDASGAVGDSARDKKGKLANGAHSHLMVASTGSPKILNVGNGGFISTNQVKFLNNSKNILKTLQADPITCAGIIEEIKNAPQVLSKTISCCEYLKENLDDVFHSELRGTNVIIPSKDPYKFSEHLRSRLKVRGGGMVTRCPRYDRTMEKAVALEIKNLDVRCLTRENMDMILTAVKKSKFEINE